MKEKSTLSVLVTLFICLMSLMASSQSAADKVSEAQKRELREQMNTYKDQLQLTEDQQPKFQEINLQFAEELQRLKKIMGQKSASFEKTDGRGILKLRTWNAGTCCDFAMYTNVNDVKFISSLIDAVTNRFRVNPGKVYVAGMSNGGMLAYRLASELPNKIAAIGVVSGTMVSAKNHSLKGEIPILHIHGEAR